jgi:hypothetical protein
MGGILHLSENRHDDKLSKEKQSVWALTQHLVFVWLAFTSPGKKCDDLSREAGSLLPQPSGLAYVLALKLPSDNGFWVI